MPLVNEPPAWALYVVVAYLLNRLRLPAGHGYIPVHGQLSNHSDIPDGPGH